MQTSLTREERLAALRQEIRRSGEETRDMRLHTWSGLWLGALGLLTAAMGVVLFATHWSRDTTAVMAAVSFTWLGATGTLLGGVVPLLALGYRTEHRDRLRRMLKPLPREEQWGVLLPLRNHPTGDTRKIVRPLLRDLGLPTELAPAAPPEGRGAEVSGAVSVELMP